MDPQAALRELQQPMTLSILTLSDHILNTALNNNPKSPSKRYSNANQTTQTPSSLAADLAHYRDFFSKLRFSYVEQVTKERFLRAVTAQEPEFVTSVDNATLEVELAEKKKELKEKKNEVREIIGVLEEQGRQLARRYEQVQLQTAQLESLPTDIAHLESTISELQQRQEPRSSDPEMAMPLQPTQDLLGERERELRNADMEIERLQASLPAKKAEVQRLQDELAPIQMRKIKAVEEAQEARKRREGPDGAADELEEKGRWLRGVESGLKAMLEV
ncbi:galactose dehydrogenase [Lecanosticta acicola]|uniref:Galactose dehydrogenase n=1 Tax=Lecanosticta acicola TaxID=111012 RepID=A0AAI8W1P0_9PEZI|nr:galactose dehydrogenase [Lecanosticta acicola]